MTPLEQYKQDCIDKQLQDDAMQMAAITQLEQLYHQLLTPPAKPGLVGRLLKRRPEAVTGIYMWGGVGRGKTYITDLFYESLPFVEKRRVHFHRFMQQIHEELKSLPKTLDPLEIVAKKLASQFRLLCLDEFHVNDIADAMLLAGLLKALFENGVTLVTTSNIPIDQLYKNGLQRERFLPAIDLLHRYTDTIELNGETDYRLNLLEKSGTYHSPVDDRSDHQLQQQFVEIAPEEAKPNIPLKINGRDILSHQLAGDVVWFEFPQICQTPRSATDYLEIARCYHTVFISNIPRINAENDGVTKRFIDLIDALYDHNVKLIASADVEPEEIYQGDRLAFPFQRTISRLREMRSHRYLSQPHTV